jgi:hypothetical protein
MSDEGVSEVVIDTGPVLKPMATGLPYEIGGRVWILPDFVPEFADVWNAVYDANLLAGSYDRGDLRACGLRLIEANYALPLDDILTVVWSCDPRELVPAVEVALFGPEKTRRTWTSWARSSLLAAGLRPNEIHPADLRDVLAQLVATGRAVPAEKWISSAEYRAYRAKIDESVGG